VEGAQTDVEGALINVEVARAVVGDVPDGVWDGGMLSAILWNSCMVSGVSFLPKFFLAQRKAVLEAASTCSLGILWLRRYPRVSESLA
jgi:hypothetical protein